MMLAPVLLATAAMSSGGDIPATPQLPACRFDRPAREVGALRDLPASVRAEVARFFGGDGGGLAEAGAMFEATDYITDRRIPRRRFIRAYLTQDVWFIWFEQGGIGRNNNTIALTRQARDGDPAPRYRATPGSWFTGDLCAGSRAFLAGARAKN